MKIQIPRSRKKNGGGGFPMPGISAVCVEKSKSIGKIKRYREKSKSIGKNQKVHKKSKGIEEKSKSVRKNQIVSKTAFT